MNNTLTIPCAYQGGKQRIAGKIVDKIINYIGYNTIFYDLCCGSGAISIELVNRGINPKNIVMVDQSPWGLFWKKIGEGSFSLDMFKCYIDAVPKDISKIQEWIKKESKLPATYDIVCRFLLLQASSFGSKSIWIKDNKWQNTSFRSYWLPTETSSRRSPVNPMMPMPETLLKRVEKIVVEMEGVTGYWDDCNNINIKSKSVIYIDPPYNKTTKYGFEFDYMEFINKYKNDNIIFLSEGNKLSETAWNLTDRRNKGGISGERKKVNDEWLNLFG